MALIEFVCTQCGAESEELVRSDGNYPACKVCGGRLKQKLSGKLHVNCAKHEHCGGNCKTCGGCR